MLAFVDTLNKNVGKIMDAASALDKKGEGQ
jgi:hypothetical protein